MSILENKTEVRRLSDVAIVEVVKCLSDHYTFSKINNIYTYSDSSVFLDGVDVLKVEVVFEFKKKFNSQDREFFMTRILSRVNEIRARLVIEEKIHITHVIDSADYSDEQLDRLMTPSIFKKIIREDAIKSLLDE